MLQLCQLLLDHEIFEPLSGNNLERKFDDSSNKYYRFTSAPETIQQVGFRVLYIARGIAKK